jgi:hypothetical protein
MDIDNKIILDNLEIKYNKIQINIGEDKVINILVKPYLSYIDKKILIETYLEDYFDNYNIAEAYINAGERFKLAVLELCTNINIQPEEGKIVDINNLVEYGLWDEITKKICNLSDIVNDINNIIKLKNEKEYVNKSIGNVIDNLSTKAEMFLNKLLEIDLSEDGIEKIKVMFGDIQTGLNRIYKGDFAIEEEKKDENIVIEKPKRGRKPKKVE